MLQTVVIQTIQAHVPSLTEAAVEEIRNRYLSADEEGMDFADAAYRICSCGRPIDGFYQYVDHLIEVFGGESHIGS